MQPFPAVSLLEDNWTLRSHVERIPTLEMEEQTRPMVAEDDDGKLGRGELRVSLAPHLQQSKAFTDVVVVLPAAPGTRHIQTACSWTPSLLPSQT